jgi:fatty acid desaturase
MSGYPVADRSHPEESAERVSVPIVIAIALLCGVGLIGVAYWLLTQNWLYFAALVPLIGGALLLFTRLSGPDRA